MPLSDVAKRENGALLFRCHGPGAEKSNEYGFYRTDRNDGGLSGMRKRYVPRRGVLKLPFLRVFKMQLNHKLYHHKPGHQKHGKDDSQHIKVFVDKGLDLGAENIDEPTHKKKTCGSRHN